MSTIITGDPTTITTPLSRTVTGATNESPIVITTSAAHLFATHDTVAITSVGGNTAANGTWTITKLTSTTFSLNGSTGSGAYTSGGTAVDQSLTPQIQVPSDGDGPGIKAGDLLPSLEALADRTQHLQAVSWAVRAGYIVADIIHANGAGSVSLAYGGTVTQSVALLSSGVPTLSGDIVVAMLAIPLRLTATTGDTKLQVKLRANQNGGGLADIAGAKANMGVALTPAALELVWSVTTLTGVFSVTTPGTLAIAAQLDLVTSGVSDSAASDPDGEYTAFYVLLRKLP